MAFTRRVAAQLSDALGGQEARAADQRLPWGDSVPPTNSMVPTIASGIPVTQKTAESVTAVYGCCSLIADSVGSLPTELRSGPTRKDSKLLKASPLLLRPYAEISRRDWWVQFIWALSLRGNFFGQRIEFNPDGSTKQIKPIENDQVTVKRLVDGSLEYRYYGKVVPPRQVFHVRYQSAAGNVLGLSPIQCCALTFGTAIAQARFVESFYLNSANPMGVIEVPGYLDRTETRKMLRGWLASHQSLNNANLPAILTEGAKFNPISISPSDAQLLDALGWSGQEICGRIFRVPPHMIGMVDRTTSWGRGIEQMERGFVANTLLGYLTIGMEALTEEHPTGQYVHFNTTERTRGATLERAQAAALLMNSGVGVADDLRDWFDWAELPDGDGKQSFMPINSQLLEAAIVALKQAKEAPAPTAPTQLPQSKSPTTTAGSNETPSNVPKRPTSAPARSEYDGTSYDQETPDDDQTQQALLGDDGERVEGVRRGSGQGLDSGSSEAEGKVARYSPDQPRDADGKFASGDSSNINADEVLATGKSAAGGGTWNDQTGKPVTDGYAVAVDGHSGIFPADKITTDDVKQWREANADVFKGNPDMCVGIWHDTEHNEMVLDPSEVLTDKDEAIKLGIDRDQQAIYDITNDAEIPTGGTGGRSVDRSFIDTVTRLGMTPEEALAVIDAAEGRRPKVEGRYSPDQPRDADGKFASDETDQMTSSLEDSGLHGSDAFAAYSSGKLADTQAIHSTVDPSTGERTYSDARDDLHEAIVEDSTAGKPSQDQPEALFTAGGPASGKSALYGGTASVKPGETLDPHLDKTDSSTALASPDGAVVVDPDAVKQKLPEYDGLKNADREDAAAAAVHEESSDVAQQVRDTAFDKSQNVVIDGVGDTGGTKFADKIDQAQKAGYDVTVRYATIDPDVAVERAEDRAEKTGRSIAESAVRGMHDVVASTFVSTIQNGVPGAKIEVYDNKNGLAPIATRDGSGSWTIHNESLYNDFVARGTKGS